MTRNSGRLSGACSSSIDTGCPRKVAVSASLPMSSRSIVMRPLMSVNGASKPSIVKPALLVRTSVVNVKLCQSRIGTLRSRLAVASPETLTRSSCPPKMSAIGLWIQSCLKSSIVLSETRRSVIMGWRKFGISSRPLTTSLPALMTWLRSVKRLMFRMTTSASMTSATGHLRWYLTTASRTVPSTSRRPSLSFSNGNWSMGPYSRARARGTRPASRPFWNSSLMRGRLGMNGT